MITIYTSIDGSPVQRNDFSIHIKQNWDPPNSDFLIHLYNFDTNVHFSKNGELKFIEYGPDHSLYSEKCSCMMDLRRHVLHEENCTMCPDRREKIVNKVIQYLDDAVKHLRAKFRGGKFM